jgi:predicted Zn-dependent peptidase
MLSLSFDDKVLEVQRKVVIEEFNQRYLNQPYGDIWLKLRPLAYQVHPYRWATIGKEISHIENATMEDVKEFFKKFYTPNNAIMVVAGDVNFQHVKSLAEKWFGPIPKGIEYVRSLPAEPAQNTTRELEVEAMVPLDAMYISFHMPARNHADFYAADLLSDILGHGKASRLYQELVKGKKIFNSLNSFTMGSLDPGQLIISGKLNADVKMDAAVESIMELINKMLNQGIHQKELTKVQNQAITSLAFNEVEILNRAMNLAFFANMGRLIEYNDEVSYIKEVTVKDIIEQGISILDPGNASILKYLALKK